jgi:hypothetical protein
MANIYYCHSENRGSGVLRAVLSSDEARSLLKGHSVQYAGQQFPAIGPEPGVDSAILRLFEGEMNEDWRVGFYRFDDGIMQIEEAVHSCDAKLLQRA